MLDWFQRETLSRSDDVKVTLITSESIMSRQQTVNLPKTQTVQIKDKLLWESIRIMAGIRDLTIYELVEIGMKYFMQSDDRAKLIEIYKIQRDLRK